MSVFLIGHRRYEHKYLAQAAVKRILNDPQHLDSGVMLTGEDLTLIQDLFDACPHYDHIKRKGVIGFEVRTNNNPEYSEVTICFWAIHPDGAASEWSQDTAMGRNETPNAKLSKAGRNATGDVIKAFRKAAFGGLPETPCASCGKSLVANQTEVHHQGDFPHDKIVFHWKDMGGDTETKSGYFLNPSSKAEFVAFHNALADLTILCKKCHKHETHKQTDTPAQPTIQI